MKPSKTTSSAEDDPATVVALIYRILDRPQRAITCALLMFPILATISKFVIPDAKLLGVSISLLWWIAGGALLVPSVAWIVRNRSRQAAIDDITGDSSRSQNESLQADAPQQDQ